MKKFSLSLLATLFTIGTFAQSTFNDSLFEFKLIDSVQNTGKDILYSRAKEWVSQTYKTSNKVIDLDDKSTETYKIFLKPVTKYHLSWFGGGADVYTNYSFRIYIKDGKYKCEIADFYCDGGVYGTKSSKVGAEGELSKKKSKGQMAGGMTQKKYDEMKDQIASEMNTLLNDFSKKMLVPVKESDGF